jgi:hypothetical protein
MTKKVLIIFIWSVYILICVIFIRMLLADMNYEKSQEMLGGQYLKYAANLSEKSVSQNPYEPNYYKGRAKVNLMRLAYVDYQLPKPLIKELILADLVKAYSLNKDNLVTIRNIFPLYYFLAMNDISLGTADNNTDPKYIEITKEFLESNKKRFWNDAGVVASVANYERKLGFVREYGESVQRIMELRPDLLNWYESFR